MNKISYKAISSQIVIENRSVSSYGLACFSDNTLLDSIEDISLDKDLINLAAQNFTKNKLDPTQFQEAVEDILAEESTYKK